MTSLNRARTLGAGVTIALAMLLGACGSGAPTGSPGPATHDAGELRLLLIDRLGPLWHCDPDEYPVSLGSEQERAIERFAEMQAEGEIFRAIAQDLGIDPGVALTDAQKLAIYRTWKVALAVQLEPIGDDRYRFDYLAQPAAGAAEGTRTAGVIDGTGAITIEQQAAAGEPMCPICLPRGTTIDTPAGAVAIEDLRLGDPIWTLDADGRRVAGTVIALGSTAAPPDHRVIRLVLTDGRAVTASPGHPLADGRAFAALEVGDVVDGSAIVSLDSLAYAGGETFDVVASGVTGAYFSNGIALGSTLDPAS